MFLNFSSFAEGSDAVGGLLVKASGTVVPKKEERQQ